MPSCFCPCHCGSFLHYAPDLRDPIAAVTACSKCLNGHTIALVSEWPVVERPNPMLMPWVDPEPDGEKGEETGG